MAFGGSGGAWVTLGACRHLAKTGDGHMIKLLDIFCCTISDAFRDIPKAEMEFYETA